MFLPPAGKPVMIITEYMENGSLDTFLKVRWQHVVGKMLLGNQDFSLFFCGSQSAAKMCSKQNTSSIL